MGFWKARLGNLEVTEDNMKGKLPEHTRKYRRTILRENSRKYSMTACDENFMNLPTQNTCPSIIR